MGMSNGQALITFKATNPVIVAAMAPAFAAPLPLIIILNQMETTWKGLAIGFFSLYMITMGVLSFIFALKKLSVTIDQSTIQIDNKVYQFAQLEKISFRQKAKYIYFKVKQSWGYQTIYLQDAREYEQVVTLLKDLAESHGIILEEK